MALATHATGAMRSRDASHVGPNDHIWQVIRTNMRSTRSIIQILLVIVILAAGGAMLYKWSRGSDATGAARGEFMFISVGLSVSNGTDPHPSAAFTLKNIGGSEATLTGFSYRFKMWPSSHRGEPRFEERSLARYDETVESGEMIGTSSDKALPACVLEDALSAQDWDDIRADRSRLVFHGYLTYRTEAGTCHKLPFSYWYNVKVGGNFTEMGAKDHEVVIPCGGRK